MWNLWRDNNMCKGYDCMDCPEYKSCKIWDKIAIYDDDIHLYFIDKTHYIIYKKRSKLKLRFFRFKTKVISITTKIKTALKNQINLLSVNFYRSFSGSL